MFLRNIKMHRAVKHSDAVLAFITAKCRQTADISDIFQDTYLELYQVLCKRGVDYIENEKAFALRIAKHKVAKYYTLLERLRLFVPMIAVCDEEEEIDLIEMEANRFSVEDFVVNELLIEYAKRFITQKPEDVKKVFYLFYDVGLSIPEIATALSIKESNVKNKLYRTLKELRSIFDE